MTVLQKQTTSPIAHLTPEDVEQIGRELDAVRGRPRRRPSAAPWSRPDSASSRSP